MTKTVPRLVPKPTVSEEYRLDAIRMLKDILAEVESGDVSAVVVLCKQVNGDWRHSSSGTVNFAETVGELTILVHSWIGKMLGANEP